MNKVLAITTAVVTMLLLSRASRVLAKECTGELNQSVNATRCCVRSRDNSCLWCD